MFLPVSRFTWLLSVVLIGLLRLAPAALAQPEPQIAEALKVAKVSAPLTDDERALAIRLAEQALKENKLFSDQKMYLTEVRANRDTAAEAKGVFERLAVLTYYRYEGDLTIGVYLNLSRGQALATKQLSNLSPPISPQEFLLAKELAFNDPRLKEALGPYRDRLIIEPFISRSGLPQDPLFRHRVVYMLFRTGPTYLLRELRVFVDLTTEKVTIEPVSKNKPM